MIIGFLKCQQVNDSLDANPKFECKECHKMLKSMSGLKNHMNYVHLIDEVRCDEDGCGQTFKNSLHLKVHKRTVTSTIMLTCDWPGCGKTFKLR